MIWSASKLRSSSQVNYEKWISVIMIRNTVVPRRKEMIKLVRCTQVRLGTDSESTAQKGNGNGIEWVSFKVGSVMTIDWMTREYISSPRPADQQPDVFWWWKRHHGVCQCCRRINRIVQTMQNSLFPDLPHLIYPIIILPTLGGDWLERVWKFLCFYRRKFLGC